MGDDRCETENEGIKTDQSFNTRRPEQENGSTERAGKAGTTNWVRGGCRVTHFLKRIQPSYDRVGLDTE